MKTQLLTYILTLSVLSFSTAQIITFDDQGHIDNGIYGNPYTIINNGETFIFTVSGVSGGPTSHRYRTTDPYGCGNTGLSHLSSGTFPATTWTIETQSGNEIDLQSIQFDNFYLCYAFAYDLTIEGFKDNISTGTQQLSVPDINTIFTANANFNNVDKIVITCADLGNMGIDDITWSASTLALPTFSIEDHIRIVQNRTGIQIIMPNTNTPLNYSLYNISGVKVATGKNTTILTSSFAGGIYILKIHIGKETVVKKIVIN